MKILIIDDDADIRSIARLSLSRVGGMEVIEAASGAEGVQKAQDEKPEVILLDMMMPTMDGLETLAALRSRPATAATPVIFLTANAVRGPGRAHDVARCGRSAGQAVRSSDVVAGRASARQPEVVNSFPRGGRGRGRRPDTTQENHPFGVGYPFACVWRRNPSTGSRRDAAAFRRHFCSPVRRHPHPR